MKIALLSNVTVAVLQKKLAEAYEVYVADGFDAWQREMMDEESNLYMESLDAVFLLLDGRCAENWKNSCDAEENMKLWLEPIRYFAERYRKSPVFLPTVDFRENRIRALSENPCGQIWESLWLQKLSAIVERDNFYIWDVKNLVTDIGRNNFYSEKMWYMGSMPYSKQGVECIKNNIISVMDSIYKKRCKVLVLDLDNTLWGRVIGEDGAGGIELSEHNQGERYYNLQKKLLEMKKRGVLLAIASKNNEEDVEAVWNHPAMLLHKGDFIAVKIGWSNKSDSIMEMQQELNLTQGSFSFLDDNPAEREEVAARCPEVTVLDFPEDSAQLPSYAEKYYYHYFRPLYLTKEDADKTEQYRQEEKRKKEKATSAGLDDYLKKLEMKVIVHPMMADERARVVQLCNKTNQFNLTSIRYTATDVEQSDADIWTVQAEDRFGKLGLVAVVFLKIVDNDPKSGFINTFLMSCRVMGRKLENLIIHKLAEFYRGRIDRIIGAYHRTKKNKPVERIYEALGFNNIAKEGYDALMPDVDKFYVLNLNEEEPDQLKKIESIFEMVEFSAEGLNEN